MMKSILIFVAGLAALIFAAAIFLLTFDLNAYKPSVEAAASVATGMKVRINGVMKLTLFPVGHMSFEDILIQNKGTDVVSARKAEMDIAWLPLFWGELRIQRVMLITPTFFISRDNTGHFNFETPEKKPSKLMMKTVSAKEGHFLYHDEKSGGKIEANGCDMAIKGVSQGIGKSPLPLFTAGDLSCAEVKTETFKILDIRAAMKSDGEMFEANPVTLRILGGAGKGSLKGVIGEKPEYSLDFTITKFRVEEVLANLNQRKKMRGELDLKSRLTAKGKNMDEIRRSAEGEISIGGQNLVIDGIDLDRALEKYDKSQRFNLVELGTFFIAGPLAGTLLTGAGAVTAFAGSVGSSLLTKGYGSGKAVEGETHITKLVSDWRVKNGVAEAEDAAFVTKKNRIALKGRLNLATERFDDVTVAALDAKGCATYSQKVHGPFKDPRVDKPSTIYSLLGPIRDLGKKTVDMLTGGECAVFYRGSLGPPANPGG